MTAQDFPPISITPTKASEDDAAFIEMAVNEYTARRGASGVQDVVDFCWTIMAGGVPDSVPYLLTDSVDSACIQLSSVVHQFLMGRGGYYAKVTKQFAASLVDVAGRDARFLDPMAGRGFLVKALQDQGAYAIGADDNSWGISRNGIACMDAVEAVRKYGDQVTHLVLAWPPYEDEIDARVLEEVRANFPDLSIIYVGEVQGCTGSQRFWSMARVVDFDQPVMYESFSVLSDYVYQVH